MIYIFECLILTINNFGNFCSLIIKMSNDCIEWSWMVLPKIGSKFMMKIDQNNRIKKFLLFLIIFDFISGFFLNLRFYSIDKCANLSEEDRQHYDLVGIIWWWFSFVCVGFWVHLTVCVYVCASLYSGLIHFNYLSAKKLIKMVKMFNFTLPYSIQWIVQIKYKMLVPIEWIFILE